MPRRFVYGVFVGKKFALTLSREKAIKFAQQKGGTVRRVRDDPGIRAYDAPTFRVLSDPVHVPKKRR